MNQTATDHTQDCPNLAWERRLPAGTYYGNPGSGILETDRIVLKPMPAGSQRAPRGSHRNKRWAAGGACSQAKFNVNRPVLRLLLLIYISIFNLGFPARALAFDQTHKQLTNELQKYVKGKGVLYAKWKEDRAGLDKYLDSLAKLSPEEYKAFSRREKRSLWLNAYNALAIKLVLDNYPIKGKLPDYPSASIRQIPNTWDAIKHNVAGREVSLYTIAHDNLRKAKDCRNHFAITPAARSGAVLQKRAYTPRTVDDDLAKLTRQFMSKAENLSCNPEEGSITVSQIFRWFPLDFIAGTGPIPMPPPQDDDVVRDYVMQFLPPATRKKLEGKEIKIIYGPYDWTLNDASS